MTRPRAQTATAPGPEGGSGPFLSVILPVGAVEGYLPACLDSVLGQAAPAGGLEVIAVDDAASDASGAILDARARADARLRVLHLAARSGPGLARTRGLAQARGAYVWFVDPDDLLPAGALTAVAARLDRDRPDVLLLDYQILGVTGSVQPSPWAVALSGADAGPVTLADRPSLINRTMTIWSKVVRREFLLGLGVSFPAGIHEDVPVSCAVLLAASRIALLDQVCYLYRRRAGSFLATPGTSHFGIFSSYHQVFAFAAALDAGGAGEAGSAWGGDDASGVQDAGGVAGAGGDHGAGDGPGGPGCPTGGDGPAGLSPQVRAALFGRAIEHYASIMASGLVPAGARREFFACMVRDFRRYRPAGYRRPPGLRGVKTVLIERGSYWAYALLTPLNRARVRARRVLRAVAGPG